MQILKLCRKGHGCGSTWLSGCRKKGEVSAKTTKKCIFQCFCGTLILPEEYETLPLQVNLFQKLSFLNQLTQNMTRDCSLNSPKNTSSEHVVYTANV